ncbi:flagellar biosynthesis anti-sigma factor FlgM [Inediibacterium massiliense]|uniref:flagellar biosynthesis anti-sigma factor FlgM n=1 Tax=Inediibacterium massiliense TaxID=1658111 RepID=UPI0006B6450C|nr:flagellar biosynthesis anti-sigma factor FlgM [Inediibacterium massiliense]
MKINHNPNIQKILSNYNKNINHVNKTEKVKSIKDQVEISQGAKDYQLAVDAYKKLPDVRKDKVEKIKNEIQSGNYHPSLKEVVDSMFDQKI